MEIDYSYSHIPDIDNYLCSLQIYICLSMKYASLLLFQFVFVFLACNEDSSLPEIPLVEASEILMRLKSDYIQLPEMAITRTPDGSVYAQYAKPTEKYPHGVMGDNVEAEQLVVVVRGEFYDLTLEPQYLFEDIRPRLYDVDQDGELEFVTIRTHMDKGAGIAIYKVLEGELVEYAHVPEVGISNRWLNPVTIHDLDDDGVVELVWVQTPHIGGIIKVAKFNPGEMTVLAESSLYSNHKGREKNLCLSVLTEQQGQKIFYVPNFNRNKIIGLSFADNQLTIEEEIEQEVDFLIPLSEQYPFEGVMADEINCINPE